MDAIQVTQVAYDRMGFENFNEIETASQFIPYSLKDILIPGSGQHIMKGCVQGAVQALVI